MSWGIVVSLALATRCGVIIAFALFWSREKYYMYISLYILALCWFNAQLFRLFFLFSLLLHSSYFFISNIIKCIRNLLTNCKLIQISLWNIDGECRMEPKLFILNLYMCSKFASNEFDSWWLFCCLLIFFSLDAKWFHFYPNFYHRIELFLHWIVLFFAWN